MKSLIERLATVLLVVSAVAVAASAVRASFFGRSELTTQSPELVDEWDEAVALSTPVAGDPAAKITIVEFLDLECPFCARFHQETLREVTAEYPHLIRVAYIHFPLDYHRFSYPAARAAECARESGASGQWLDTVYGKQDSLGLKSWGSYALEAGIADTARIHACATDSGPVVRIDSGRELGLRIGITGTPTILINGWRFFGVPTKMELTEAVEALLKGQPLQ